MSHLTRGVNLCGKSHFTWSMFSLYIFHIVKKYFPYFDFIKLVSAETETTNCLKKALAML